MAKFFPSAILPPLLIFILIGLMEYIKVYLIIFRLQSRSAIFSLSYKVDDV
ncbi:Nucleoside permease nupC [Helicobacter felis]|uniref:Nucleoside permease nupC n=1 Tax=Helicobacter felis (strain ATCC 49179 / CCUG 28539 / NCTC 12436 / CS1) TaxID=936155 RepID=E7AB09_HELFC|nr:nucleoside permease nupC [Helicobacter felis ATCC 49179]